MKREKRDDGRDDSLDHVISCNGRVVECSVRRAGVGFLSFLGMPSWVSGEEWRQPLLGIPFSPARYVQPDTEQRRVAGSSVDSC